MASFDENGKYIKTNWKAGDKITSTKLNKIEESIEAVNDNDISRHVEADARLDALEAKDVAHDKELTKIKNDIANNKAAAELGDYDINSRMTFLENELNEGIEEVHNVAETVDGKIAAADANMKAMVTEVDGKIAEAEANMTSATNAMTTQVNNAKTEMTTQVNNAKSNMAAQVDAAQAEMTIQVSLAKDDMRAQVNSAKSNMTAQVNSAKSEVTSQLNSAMDSVNTTHAAMLSMVDYVDTEIFTFENQVNTAKDKINTQVNNAKSEMAAQINQGKADMEAMVAEVEGELGKKVNNFYGTNNVGKILMVGEDGYLVIDDAPAGSGGGSYPVVGTVDDDNVITLSSDELVDGLYTLRYSDGTEYKLIGTVLVGERIATSITATKGKTTYEVGETLTTNDIVVTAHFNDLTSEVVTGYTVDSSSVKMNAEGNYAIRITYENCTTSIPIVVMDMSVTGNLFVASTCTLNKRISSTGDVKDQSNTFLTDYIEIGNCMAMGGENIIHWQGFHMYKVSSSELEAAGVQPNKIGTYRGVAYYDATGRFLGQDSLYVTDKVFDSEGNYQLTLNASYTTATKLRIFAVTLPPATSVSQLSNCKLTLNQLISEI